MQDVSATKYMLCLCFVSVIWPMLQIAAGVLLLKAAKQLGRLNGSQRLITVCDTLGVAFLFYITIATVHSLSVIIPILWP